MKEKERYVIGNGDDVFISDNYRKVMFTITTKKLQDLLNQQDKRIKELEQENLSLQEQSIRDNQNWIEETTQLKQQLHDLPNKIVEEIKTEVEKEKSDNDLAWLGFKKLNRILDTILKKFGGKENGKSNM